jgi:ABC-type branched-subunit amino acid transport system permease subunit
VRSLPARMAYAMTLALNATSLAGARTLSRSPFGQAEMTEIET